MLPTKVNVISISYVQRFYWSIDLLDRFLAKQKAADNGGLARAEWPTKEVSSCAPARQPAGALHTNPGLHPATHKLTCTARRQYHVEMAKFVHSVSRTMFY